MNSSISQSAPFENKIRSESLSNYSNNNNTINKERQPSEDSGMASSPLAGPFNSLASYLKYLLGISPNTTKRTLSEEAECGLPESLNEWIRKGSDPNETDDYGYTPLINASLRGCSRTVKFLIENGAEVNKKASHGYSPLHAAAQNGYVEVCELLLDANADTEIKNDDEDTPLMLAVRSEHAHVVDLLCQRGCDLHTQGFDHIEPIDYARNKRNKYLSEMLLKYERQQSGSTSSNRLSTASNLNSSSESQNILKSSFDDDHINNNDNIINRTLDVSIDSSSSSFSHAAQNIKSKNGNIEYQSNVSHDSVFQAD